MRNLHTNPIGQRALTAESATTLTTINQPYKVNGTFSDNGTNFHIDGSGYLVYDGEDSVFLFLGSGNLESDKVAKITLMLYIDSGSGDTDTGVSGALDFEHANSLLSLSAVYYGMQINTGDKISVYAKSDTASTTLTCTALNTVFIGEGNITI